MRDEGPMFSVGEVVYEPYSPLKYGRIIDQKVDPDISRRIQRVTYNFLVRWKDGTESWHWENYLKSLNKLVEDHRKKLARHEKNIEKALAL